MITRRALLQAASCTAMGALAGPAWAADYPARPVTWVVPYAAGGATGHLAQPICERLSSRLGQPFIQANRPGGGGNVGTASVASAPPDGYAILGTSTANAINVTFDPSLPFDATHDLIHVAVLARMPLLLLISNELPVKTLAEFVAYAKANPGKLSVGSAGLGTVQHLSAEVFRAMAGLEWTNVHYRGSGPGIADLSSGHIHAMFDNIASSLEPLQSGKVRALAVTTRQPCAVMPELPPIWNVLPGYETAGFYGTAVPRGTPQDIVALLNREINLAIADPIVRKQFDAVGATPVTCSTRDCGGVFAAEIVRWRQLIKLARVSRDG